MREILSFHSEKAIFCGKITCIVPVAQLDRALVCGTKGCRFDSDQVRSVICDRMISKRSTCSLTG